MPREEEGAIGVAVGGEEVKEELVCVSSLHKSVSQGVKAHFSRLTQGDRACRQRLGILSK